VKASSANPDSATLSPNVGNIARLVLYAAVVAGLAFRVREAFVHNPLDHLFSDPLRHWEAARDPFNTSPMVLIDPPLYQMWLSLAQRLTLAEPRLVSAYAAAMSVATPWCWYLFLREQLGQRTLALAGWVAFAWMPSWIGIFSYSMTETLFLPLLGLSLWQTLRAKRLRSVRSFSAMVALFTLTALTRAIALPLGGVAGLIVWIKHPKKVRTALGSLLIIGAMLGPFALRNHAFMNLWSPLGSGYLNGIYAGSGKKNIDIDLTRDGARWQYTFGSPSFYASQLAPLSNWAPKREGTVKVSVDIRKGPVDWESERNRTAVHGADLLRLEWENTVLLMLGVSWPDNNPAYAVAVASMATRWIWAPLFVLVLGLCAAAYRATWKRPLVPALIVTWFVFQGLLLLAVNEGRYRKPLEGLLVVQTLTLIEQFVRRRYA
jgi:hypothetical protein